MFARKNVEIQKHWAHWAKAVEKPTKKKMKWINRTFKAAVNTLFTIIEWVIKPPQMIRRHGPEHKEEVTHFRQQQNIIHYQHPPSLG